MPVYLLDESLVFPAPSLARKDGLLAVGGDLSVKRLLLAYSAGIFPWYTDSDPILWWSPDPRLVLKPHAFHLPRRMRRACRRCGWWITLDRSFAQVISACAGDRGDGGEGTWITTEMAAAYCRLHALGYAHSVEVWDGDALIGGLYGVSVGKGYFGESMFSRRPNASKAALAALVAFLFAHGFYFIDCQVTTRHLMQFGARELPRAIFLKELKTACEAPGLTGRWEWTVAAADLAGWEKGQGEGPNRNSGIEGFRD